MKKVIIVLSVAAIALGLAACGRTAENQDTSHQTATAGIEQRDEGIPDDNVSTIPSSNEQIITQEQLVGTVQTIEEMSISIATVHATIFNESSAGPNQHIVVPRPDEPQEPQEPPNITVRLTEHTIIEVNETSIVTGVGQVADKRAGTIDDLALGVFVMATGEWQDDEFVAAALTIMLQ